ncbi:MAG: diphthine synthase [Thermoplasmata archaeon]|nr:diphthine synthase [Thermoplasmata archaeon]
MKKGELVFIGLGLYDEKDISLKGVELVKKCDKIFAEFYTSVLTDDCIEKLEDMIGKKIEVLNREEVEDGRVILEHAMDKKVAFLVGGDPLSATTHVDLRIRAKKQGVDTKIIHGSSIFTAIPGLLGLQHYKFGRVTTLMFPHGDFFPKSPYEIIYENKSRGLHTLVLLDIDRENNRFMSANEGMKLLFDMEESLGKNLINDNLLVCVVARAGSDNPVVKAGRIKRLIREDFGSPLHTLVVPGNLHFMEVEALISFAGLEKDELG